MLTLGSSPTIEQDDKPILTDVCEEYFGRERQDVVRSIYEVPLTIENLNTVWERSKQFRTLFADDVAGDFKKYCEVFIGQHQGNLFARGLLWKLDDFVGVYYLTGISAGDAIVHYSFFDRKHFGRTNITKAMLTYVFQEFGFRRLTTSVGMYATPSVFAFVHGLGFKKEGRKRKAVLFKGEWFDTTEYGILREDVLNGSAI